MRKRKEKVKEEGVIPSLNDSNEIILTSDFEGGVVETENLTEKIMELTKLYGSLKVEVKDYSPRTVERAPVYKYTCSACGEEIKSKLDGLHAEHKECKAMFVQEDKE